MLAGEKTRTQTLLVKVFAIVPLLALVAAMPIAWGWGLGWVADHRRHHAYADTDGDPHSPWLFGTSAAALAKGFWHAHMGWRFGREQTNARRFARTCSPTTTSGASTGRSQP